MIKTPKWQLKMSVEIGIANFLYTKNNTSSIGCCFIYYGVFYTTYHLAVEIKKGGLKMPSLCNKYGIKYYNG